MDWNWVRKCPMRKLLVIIVTFVWILVVFTRLHRDADIPPGINALILTFGGLVYTSYFGTSTIEAVKDKNIKRDHDHDQIILEENLLAKSINNGDEGLT